jgi:CheY-like chemotaxis protein
MGKTLLLADDSVTIQKVVGISFASEDIAIKTVDNGDDAISRARELRPDVILADVVMPGKSGYEVCEAIKADPALRHIPVLLLTGTFEAFDEQRAARAGAAGHVAKPFEAQTLVERVKALLAQPARPAAPAPRAEAPAAPPRPAPVAKAAPAPAPTPPPAPARASAGEAFDFFDEPQPAAAARTPAAVEHADLEVEAADAVFAFGDDDLSSAEPDFVSPSPPPLARATTVAILPGDAPERAAPVRPLPPRPGPPPAPPRVATPPPRPAAADFDFEFEGVSAAARSPARAREVDTSLAEATLLDPTGSSAFDVSSSDLGSLVASREPVATSAAATQLIDHPIAAEPVDDFVEFPSSPPGSRTDVDLVTPDVLADEDDAGWPEQAIETEPDLPPPPPDRKAARSEPRPGAPPAVRPQAQPAARVADEALAQNGPALREQIHETLEKIAWEAFGNATETIVEQAVERLEKVAWEVVPKLAETLILEEIRKLKAE